MKIVLAVQRKMGQPNFGSEGASCEITLDLPEASARESALLVAEIRAAYDLAERAVGEQLARHGGPPVPAIAAAEPAAAAAVPAVASLGWVHGEPDPPRPPRRTNASSLSTATATTTAVASPPSRPERNSGSPSVRPGPGRALSTGRALYAWVRDRDPSGALGLLRALDQLAKAHGWPARVVDWGADQVGAGISLVEERLARAPTHDQVVHQ